MDVITIAPEINEEKKEVALNEQVTKEGNDLDEWEEDVSEDDDDDDFFDRHRELYNTSCDVIRRKITMFLATKEMTQKAFLEAIGHVNSNSFRNFMSYKGRDRGSDNCTFRGAVKFFYRRDQQKKEKKAAEKAMQKAEKAKSKSSGVKRKAGELYSTAPDDKENMLNANDGNSSNKPKKAAKVGTNSSPSGKKTKAEVAKFLEDILAVPLEDRRVYDDCDEVRRKIAQFIQLENVPMSKFAAAIDVTVPPINSFLSKKGAKEGAGSNVYRDSYYFFEKLRLLRNEPKSHHRLMSEKEYRNGYALENPNKRVWICVRNY